MFLLIEQKTLFLSQEVDEGFAAVDDTVGHDKEQEIEGDVDEEDDREGHLRRIHPQVADNEGNHHAKDNTQRLMHRQPTSHQHMMDMPLVSLEHRLTVQQTCDRHTHQIENRHDEQRIGNQERIHICVDILLCRHHVFNP